MYMCTGANLKRYAYMITYVCVYVFPGCKLVGAPTVHGDFLCMANDTCVK